MKKLFIFTFVLSLFCFVSCSKEEKEGDPYANFWGFHVKDTTGLKVLKIYGDIPYNGGNGENTISPTPDESEIDKMFKHFLANTKKETNITYLIGLRNQKLWVGKFSVTTKEQLHEWISKEDFIIKRTVNLGYGDIKKYDFDLKQSGIQIVIQSDDKIAILAGMRGYKDLYFAYQNNIKIYNNEDEIDFLGEWDDGFVSWIADLSKPSTFYSPQGDLLYKRVLLFENSDHPINLWRCFSINAEEAIYDLGLDNFSRINLKTGETIWETHILLDNIPNDAKLSYEITSKKNSFWTYSVNITYYSGEKETRQFKINIDNGEIEYL